MDRRVRLKLRGPLRSSTSWDEDCECEGPPWKTLALGVATTALGATLTPVFARLGGRISEALFGPEDGEVDLGDVIEALQRAQAEEGDEEE